MVTALKAMGTSGMVLSAVAFAKQSADRAAEFTAKKEASRNK
jgi:hypothetical protein